MPGLVAVADVVNVVAAPFQQGPDPSGKRATDVAHWVSHVIKAGTGVLGFAANAIDYGIASGAAALGEVLGINLNGVAMPAVTTLAIHLGPPHAHTHPPSFGAPLPSLGAVVGPGAVTVFIGGLPAARCGDFGIAATCGGFMPPFEIVTGSINVFIGGSRAARMADLTKHCNAIDPPSPAAKAFGMSGQALDKFGAGVAAAGLVGAVAGGESHEIAQAAADAAAFAIKAVIGKDPGVPPLFGALVGPPMGNTLIGGIPCPGIGSHVGGAITKGLGKALGRAASRLAKGATKLRQQKPKCSGGHPIYLVTGENYDEYLDLATGLLFQWRRHYTSARRTLDGPLGHGFRHYYQRRLERRLHRATFTDWDGVSVEFARFERRQSQVSSEGYVLRRLGKGHFRLSHRGQPDLEFVGKEFDDELPLTRVIGDAACLELEYDSQGRLCALLEAPFDATLERRRFELGYDEHGHVRELREVSADPLATPEARRAGAIRCSYTYSEDRDLIGVTDAEGGRWSARYDPIHRLVEQTDARGYRYEYTYDANSRCIASCGQDGQWSCRMEYEDGLTRYTEGDATWEFHYDDAGVVTKIINPYGGEEIRRLDDEGRIGVEVDAGGRERRWLYDENGCHFARVDRFGHVFPPESVQPRAGNPFARSLPGDTLGFLLDGCVGRNPEAMLGLDRALLAPLSPEIAAAAERCFRWRFSATEAAEAAPPNPVRPESPKVTHDRMGRKVREQDALGRVRTWAYDASGNLVSEADRDGRRSTREIISWNLVGTRSDAMGHAVRYEYSPYERIVAIIDPAGNESRYDYDLENRLVRVHRHGRVREEYVYDAGDHFIQKRDGDGNLLFENAIHDNHLVATRQLASGGHHQFDYDSSGRITEASTEAHRILLRYGASGRRTADLRDGLGVEHRHTATEAVTLLLDRFEQCASWRGAGVLTAPTGETTRIERHGPGLVRRQCANGTLELLQFDEQGHLEASLRSRHGRFGIPTVDTLRCRYSSEGDLLESHDTERGTTRYAIDAAHRLDAVRAPGGTEHSYRLDAAGNLRAHPESGHLLVAPGNLLDATTEETFRYDRRNYLATRTSRRDQSRRHYTYDAFDMLVAIEREEPALPSLERLTNGFDVPPRPETDDHPDATPHCASWRAAYDALGRRLWTAWTAHDGRQLRRDFYWDGDRLAAEVLPSGRLRLYQYASPTSLAPLQFTDYEGRDSPAASGKTYHIFSNPTGLPLCIEDDRGCVAWWVEYADPYGWLHLRPRQDIDYAHPGASIEYNLRWPGHYFDPETGLHYNRYRYYDPRLGRYLQCDPLGHGGSPVNLYAYCANPLVQVDVLGLTTCGGSGDPPGARENAGPPSQESLPSTEPTSAPAVLDGLTRATVARDAALAELNTLPSKQRNQVATVVGAHDPATGNVAVGVKRSGQDHGKCAEDLAAAALGNPDPRSIEFTPVVRPRNDEVIPRCDRCIATFGPEPSHEPHE